MIEIHAGRSLELNDVVVYVVMPKPRAMGGSNPITKRVRKEEVVLRDGYTDYPKPPKGSVGVCLERITANTAGKWPNVKYAFEVLKVKESRRQSIAPSRC